MFDSIGGLPLHALVVHAVVAAIPLCLVLAVLFAIPRTRRWARWPLGLVALGALAVTFVARQSGPVLEAALKLDPKGPVAPLIARHSHLANQLYVIMIIFAVLSVAAVFTVSRPVKAGAGTATAAPSTGRRALDIALVAAVLVTAVLAAIWCYRVGDLGARAVWNPAGSMNYGSGP